MAEGRRRLKRKEEGSESIDLTPSAQELGVEELVIAYGEELYAPVQYHSFRCGGHSVKLIPQQGETVKQLHMRGLKILADLTDKEFDHRLNAFRQRYSETRS